MTVEIISWSISTKVWYRAGIELATPGSAVRHASVARHYQNFAWICTIFCCHFTFNKWLEVFRHYPSSRANHTISWLYCGDGSKYVIISCLHKCLHTKYIMLKKSASAIGLKWLLCMLLFIFFLGNRVWSFNYLQQFFSILKNYFYINFLCLWGVLQILIGNGYPADGQLLCTIVNIQNST